MILIFRNLLSDKQKKWFETQTFIGLTQVSRMNTIWGNHLHISFCNPLSYYCLEMLWNTKNNYLGRLALSCGIILDNCWVDNCCNNCCYMERWYATHIWNIFLWYAMLIIIILTDLLSSRILGPAASLHIVISKIVRLTIVTKDKNFLTRIWKSNRVSIICDLYRVYT